MAARRMGIIAILLCCLLLRPIGAQAAATTQAVEPVSPQQLCALTVTYTCDGTSLTDLPVKLYKIADVSADYQYALTDAFADSALILNGVQSTGEWNVIRSTLETYVLANGVEPDAVIETDEVGQAQFEALPTGLYLVSAQRGTVGETICCFDAALTALPALGDDGRRQYRAEIVPKGELLPPITTDELTEFKVVKLWKGDYGRTDRPNSVEIEIFRDGVSDRRVTLSQENQWTYCWSAENDGTVWKVTERNTPAGYTATVEQRETSFVVTNARNGENFDEPSVPQTGDTSRILLYVLVMNAAGIMLVILGLMRKRSQR